LSTLGVQSLELHVNDDDDDDDDDVENFVHCTHSG